MDMIDVMFFSVSASMIGADVWVVKGEFYMDEQDGGDRE